MEETLVDVIYRSPPKIVQKLRPGATGWIIRGEPTYECLEWDDEYHEKPSKEEWERELDLLIQEFHDTEYQRKRILDYPSIGDQLDALFHAGLFPKEMAEKIQAVKNRHPKPLDT